METLITTMKIEFLGMQMGCPNTPNMYQALAEALEQLCLDDEVKTLDLADLAGQKDPRCGYGSPTILVNGNDLFGSSPVESFVPACRLYPAGLPGAKEIADALRPYLTILKDAE